MSIQTAFRKAYEPLLHEFGFRYWKKGFYKYVPESQYVYCVCMDVRSAKREIMTFIWGCCFADGLEITPEKELIGAFYDSVSSHPLYEKMTPHDHNRMRIEKEKVDGMVVMVDLGPYDDESALAQFAQQGEFLVRYMLPDYLKITDAEKRFAQTWKQVEPLYENPITEDGKNTYGQLSEWLLYEALQVGRNDVALRAAERVVRSKEKSLRIAAERSAKFSGDKMFSDAVHQARKEYERACAICEALQMGEQKVLDEYLCQRLEASRSACEVFFKRFPKK